MVIILAQYNEFVCDNDIQMISMIDCDDDRTRAIVTEIMQIVTNTCNDEQVRLWRWSCKQVFWSQQCSQTNSSIATMCTNKQAAQRQLAHKCTIVTCSWEQRIVMMFVLANDCNVCKQGNSHYHNKWSMTLIALMFARANNQEINCVKVTGKFLCVVKCNDTCTHNPQKSLFCLDRLDNKPDWFLKPWMPSKDLAIIAQPPQ